MPDIASLTLKETPVGTEEIPVNDSGADRKITVGGIQQPAASHIANESNPHNVTKSQVGLSNVDNTSDANKPVSTAQAAAIAAVSAGLAPQGLLSASGLTLSGTGLAGRQAAGAGAMQLITIGTGLDLSSGVLSVPPGVNLVNERFTEVNTSTTDDDYLVVLSGNDSRTITLKADSPVGKIIVVRNSSSNALAVAEVTAPVGGTMRVPSGSAVTFFKATTGWLPISEQRTGQIRIFNDLDDSYYDFPPNCVYADCVSNSGLELGLLPPTDHIQQAVTFLNRADSTAWLQVTGHIDGASGSDLLIYPGETLTLVPTPTTWRTLSGPIITRHSRLTSNVIANGTANTLVEATELGFSVIAGGTYRFKFVIPYTAAVSTTGSRWTINGPTTSMLSYWSRYPLTATTETFNHGLTSYRAPAASNATSIVAGNIAVVEGIATFSASGTLVLEFANEVSSSAITALAGATGELTRVG